MCAQSHHWTSSTEPHAIRRKVILQKYGDQIRPLVGNNPWTVLPIAVAVVLQTAAALALGIYDVPWWAVFVLAWAVGSVGAGNLMAAHHEISHYLVFKKTSWNRALMIAANGPLGVPLGSLFKQYHVDHHSEMVCARGGREAAGWGREAEGGAAAPQAAAGGRPGPQPPPVLLIDWCSFTDSQPRHSPPRQ